MGGGSQMPDLSLGPLAKVPNVERLDVWMKSGMSGDTVSGAHQLMGGSY